MTLVVKYEAMQEGTWFVLNLLTSYANKAREDQNIEAEAVLRRAWAEALGTAVKAGIVPGVLR